MAQFVECSIDVDGKSIKQFSSFTLTQSIFEHHAFRLVCPAEAIDGTSSPIFSSSRNMIGGSFSIQVKAVGAQGSLQFKGVVTQVESSRHSGHAGDIIISGYSPTILLDNGPHCKSWEKKAVKNIAQDVLKHFPQNLLQPRISPTYGETLAYTVQYKETAWQFLSRLSATYGEWFYYDGQKLVLGSPQGNKAELVYGRELLQFNMALQVRPASFQMMAYDYINTSTYDGAPSGIASKAGLNELGKHALQKSEQFYSTKPKLWHNNFLTNKKQLDDYVNTRAAMQSSNMVRFNGTSGHPGIQLGGTASVQGKNVFNQSDENFGEHTVISVNHYCDGQGNYSNDFIAIPSGVKMPPVTDIREPHCETQSAIVTDNNDSNGLARVRVKFHWMNGSEKTPWVRMTSTHGGSGKGGYFMPEKGEEVIVGFEGDRPEKPYIVGTVYNSKAKNEYANAENDLKVIQTRSGHLLEFNDAEGAESIKITDKNKNSITINTPSNDISINALNNISINAGGSMTIMARDNITIGAMNINSVSGASFNVQATALFSLNTMTSMTNVSKMTMLRTKSLTNLVSDTFNSSATTINQVAKKDITSKAKNKIIFSAQKKLEQKAGEMDVSTSKGKLRLKAKSNTELKGQQVKSN